MSRPPTDLLQLAVGLFLQRYCYISSASPSLASTRMQQTVAVEQTPRETSPRNRRQPPTSRPPPIRRSTEVDDRTGVSFTIFRVKNHTERQRSAEHRSNTLTRISRSGISSNVTRERADTKTTTATQVTRNTKITRGVKQVNNLLLSTARGLRSSPIRSVRTGPHI